MDPTLAGFQDFITNVMGINSTVLPTSSVIIPAVYNLAINTVNQALQCIDNANPAQATIYAFAVYNLAGDFLVNYAQDQVGQTFFSDLRKSLGLNSAVLGIINSTSDVSTSQGMIVPEWASNLTFANLQSLKTPWGRNYLGFAQSYGSTIWGIS